MINRAHNGYVIHKNKRLSLGSKDDARVSYSENDAEIKSNSKKRYANYTKSLNTYGVIPHNEAFMKFTIEKIEAIGINAHSKKSVMNSLRLYQDCYNWLSKNGYKEKASGLRLVVYNNKTGEVKQVSPQDLDKIYRYAPDEYSIDHSKIHPDEQIPRIFG